MNVEILGPGCRNCHTLEARTREALARLGADGAQVAAVTDITAIASRGVLRTPGLAVDGRLVMSGRVPSVDELVEMLRTVHV